MATIYKKFKCLLPFDESQESNTKRNTMWQKWDTNLHGFVKVEDIEDGLNRQFEFIIAENITFIVAESYKKVRETLVKSVFGPNYLQRKQFRFFLGFLDKLIEKMLIFEAFDSNKDGLIDDNDLKKLSKVLVKWNLSELRSNELQRLASNNKLDLNNFMDWISSLPYFSINDIK